PIRVDRICTMVVLPAPFGPSSAKIVPWATWRSMPSRTTLSPKDLRSPATAIADRRMGLVMSGPFRSRRRRGGRWGCPRGGGGGGCLDRVVARSGALGGTQVVVDAAEACVEVQPGGDTVADPDLDLAQGGLGEHGAMRNLAQADVAVGGLRSDRLARLIDRDPAVGRVHPQ